LAAAGIQPYHLVMTIFPRTLSPFARRNASMAALLVAGSALSAALAIQWAGYEPCELCLRQRLPYYAGLPALAAALLADRLLPAGTRAVSILTGVALAAFLLAFALAVHHVGVEHGLWEGPVRCVSRTFDMSSLDAFAAQIGRTPMVSCNVPAFRLLGFSLATWNVAATAIVSTLLFKGFESSRILRKSKDS
jgi:disulfide bond formation protein DsbB